MGSYKLNPKKLLQFLVEIDSAESLTSQAAIAKLSCAAKAINESTEKAIKGMFLISSLMLHSILFHSSHLLPTFLILLLFLYDYMM